MKCSRDGCDKEGKWALKLSIPATGVPIDLHTPLTMIMGLVTCDEHFEEIDIADFLKDENLREVIRIQARVSVAPRIPIEPDFARAWKSKCALDSKEYKILAGMRQK